VLGTDAKQCLARTFRRAARGPAELLQRLLRAGLSRYEPDPLQAIAESSDGENDTKPSDAKRISRPTLTGLYRFQFFSRADQQLLALPIPNNHVLGRKCDYLPFLFVVPHILELQHPLGRTDARVVEPVYFAKCSGASR